MPVPRRSDADGGGEVGAGFGGAGQGAVGVDGDEVGVPGQFRVLADAGDGVAPGC